MTYLTITKVHCLLDFAKCCLNIAKITKDVVRKMMGIFDNMIKESVENRHFFRQYNKMSK